MNQVGTNRVRKGWEYRAQAHIWRVHPSGTGLIIGEDRDPAEKRVSFFCVDAGDGTVAWKGLTLPEPWWVSMETVAGNLLLLHEYPVPSMPEHRKIFAVDIRTGESLWTNEDLTFSFATAESIFASREMFDRRVFYELDPDSGEPAREIDVETLHAIEQKYAQELEPLVALPAPVTALPASVKSHLAGATVHGSPERLDCGRTAVISCYETLRGPDTSRALREHVFVVDVPTDELLYHDVVCDGLKIPAPAGFFSLGETVYYIKDKSRLISISLT